MRVVFAGTPEFAVPALEALAASAHTLVGVLTQPDRPSGRGRRLKASAVKQAALELGLPVEQPQALLAPLETLAAWRPDVMVVVAYGLILPQAVLDLPRLGCINIHASLLPRWRGAAPVQRAILAGDTETGVTLMQMDRGLDTGPILAQRRHSIDRSMTGARLHSALAALGAECLIETLAAIEAGTARAHAQPQPGVTYATKIAKSEALIDWRSSALAIERQVRAFDPWPIAETRLDGEPLRILAARAAEEARGDALPIEGPPGTLLALRPDAVVVRCGEGRLEITTLQSPGRKPLAAREFANAGRLSVGQRLG